MPFKLPTPDDLAATFSGAMETNLPGAEVRSAASVLGTLARALALAIYPLHLFAQWLSRQLFPDTAESENLERHASLWGISRSPAAVARGSLSCHGLPGTRLPAGTELTLGGQRVVTESAVLLDLSGSASVPVRALVAGTAGNQPPGAPAQPLSPLLGLDTLLTETGLSGGTELEAEEEWRDRLLDRIQQPPHGGSAADYTAWARQVPGVAQVAVHPEEFGPGTVGVCFSVFGASPLPSSEQVSRVAAHLQTVRPVTARVSVQGVTPVEIPLHLALFPDSPRLRRDVEAAILLFFATAPIGEPLFRSQLSEAISQVSGETAHRLLAPAEDISIPCAHLPIPGPILFEDPTP